MKRKPHILLAFSAVVFLTVWLLAPLHHREVEASTKIYIGNVSLPLKEYPPGSFFTKDGKACTKCHYDDSIDCIKNGSKCNCLRYVTIDGKKVDLLGTQCFGFARYVQYRVFGYHDASSSKFYSVGSLSKGKVTESAVKDLISRSKPGAHIRFKLSNSSHSAVLLSSDKNGFTVYHANAGGDGVESKPCVVSTKYYTYSYFASYAYRGIEYIKLPYDYPSSSVTRTSAAEKETGTHPTAADTVTTASVREKNELVTGIYRTTEYLNLRTEPDNNASSLGVIKKGTELYVREIYGCFGRTERNGKVGWIWLDYADLLSGIIYTVKDGSVRIQSRGISAGDISGMFIENVTVTSKDGNKKDTGDKLCTGDVLSISADDEEKTFVISVTGDLNGDGNSDVTDVILMKKYLIGILKLEGAYLMSADLSDSGGAVSVIDYLKLKMFIK